MIRRFLFIVLSFSLFACQASKVDVATATTLDVDQVSRAVHQLKQGAFKSPLSLEVKRLSLNEIAEYLEMDQETTKIHLKSSNIHGYYSLIANNYPPGQTFSLYYSNLSGDVKLYKSYRVNSDGNLETMLDQEPLRLENNLLFFANYLPAEPIDFVLKSSNGSYLAATSIVPNPVQVKDLEGRKLCVVIASKDKKTYRIEASGLRPFEPYSVIVAFESDKRLHDMIADAEGRASLVVSSSLPWAKGGSAKVELSGKGFNRPLILSFHWGI